MVSSSGMRAGAVSRNSTRPAGARVSSARLVGPRLGAASPASTASGTKRKDRDFDAEPGGEETNINVVVRCRGRNEREVRESSTVVVTTDSVKGRLVELSMGANALSNKTYSFDRVFSPAADQHMVFDDTVKPILEQMLAGYNCTIFAYGQTGTGKTYTMSGDMTETTGMLSDEAGIIPRVLQHLFNKLELDTENCVKCSFIELYNEELRDLLSVEETAKLKIFDDVSRKGHAGTIIQGMEEKHIKNASEGIKVLQDGSLKRQVAATKCNDLSSRSHTVFTITAYVKKAAEHGGDDFVSAGKLNLVDLAGSENIARSGAENKRAAEAGLINKSLLTLGRVINALVDRSGHIPYRESKLTRLLQDSLGGRTKTCVIATISPAKSNLEETMSTLDYAFRAKNIRNKPQLNPLLNKKMLLKDFTSEIEKLKSELISTRQRNGVYLSNDAFEEMTAQSETRRIVLDEQAAKIETLETNLRNKVQELFSLNTAFIGLRKDHDGTKALLDEAKGLLDQTEIVLAATRKSLADEAQLRRAHEQTEEKLTEIGGELISKLRKTVRDVGGLHAKNKRKSDLQSLNRAAWGTSQAQMMDVTSLVERRVLEFRDEQLEHVSSVSRRMEQFVGAEFAKLSATQASLDEHLGAFVESKRQIVDQRRRSKDDMDEALEGIKAVGDAIKAKVAESVRVVLQAAERMSADVLHEMGEFHDSLHSSYSSLGKDLKAIFEELVRHMTAQRSDADALGRQLQGAASAGARQTAAMATRVHEVLGEERRQAAEERQKLLAQVTALVTAHADAQEARLSERVVQLQSTMAEASASLEAAGAQFGHGREAWEAREGQLLEEVRASRDKLKTKLKDDWTAAAEQSTAMQQAVKSAQAETVRALDEQMDQLDAQMGVLDDLLARARAENAGDQERHAQSVQALSRTAEQSFGTMSAHIKTTHDRVRNLGEEMELDTCDVVDGLEPLEAQLCRPLVSLREGIAASALHEYQPTGQTPQKVLYTYPTKLPRTRVPDLLLLCNKADEGGAAGIGAREDEDEGDEGDDGEVGDGLDEGGGGLDLDDHDEDDDDDNDDGDSDVTRRCDTRMSISTTATATTVLGEPDAGHGQRMRQRTSPPLLFPWRTSVARGSLGRNRPSISLREISPNLGPAPKLDSCLSMAAAEPQPTPTPSSSLLLLLPEKRATRASSAAQGRENVPLAADVVWHGPAARRKSPRLK